MRPDIADQLAAFMRFATLSDVALDPDTLKDGRYLVVGYPGFRVEKDEMDQTIVAQFMPYFTGLYGDAIDDIARYVLVGAVTAYSGACHWSHRDAHGTRGRDLVALENGRSGWIARFIRSITIRAEWTSGGAEGRRVGRVTRLATMGTIG